MIHVNLCLSLLAVNRCGMENQGYVFLLTSVTEADQELNNILVIKNTQIYFLRILPNSLRKEKLSSLLN